MKKIFCLIFCFLFISGCNKQSSNISAVTTGLNFTAQVEFNNTVNDFSVEIGQNGEVKTEVLTGEFAGLEYIFQDETVTANYNGIKYKTEISSLPDGIFTDFIYSVFSTLSKEKPTVYFEDDQYYVKGETQKYNFKMYLGETGLPIKIEDTENGITATIKNVTVV